MERIKAFLRSKRPKEPEWSNWFIDSLGRTTSPGYTMDDAISELLEEVGF